MNKQTFFWHDYETFGVDPQRDRASQFAGVRTDLDFNIIDEPINIYCQLADDCLPNPESCLITGITPQIAKEKGDYEAEFIRLIELKLARPETCTVGYNNLRFDDEVTRNLLYRNFYDPYAREWQHGNSRWDLIDVVRATCALRPEGIEWPKNETGVTSFRLELLTEANNISHQEAHEALSDVYATIAMAKLIKETQPKLYSFFLNHRIKSEASKLLQLGAMKPLLHVSGKYPAHKNCLAVVVPLAQHPTNSNGVLVYDLSEDPEPLLDLSAEQIQQRIFTATADLAEGVNRIPIKTVHINKCPILAPLSALRKEDAERLQIDLGKCFEHLEKMKINDEWKQKLPEIFTYSSSEQPTDPDLMIYSGGFFSYNDKTAMAKIRHSTPEQLASLNLNFEDCRLPEMLFRYRARNFSETLNSEEQSRWSEFCRNRLIFGKNAGASLGFSEFWGLLKEKSALQNSDKSILDALADYGKEKMQKFSITETDLLASQEIS